MRHSALRIVVVTGIFLGVGSFASAQSNSKKEDDSKKLAILSVTVNRVSETLSIHGAGFGRRSASVFIEKMPLTVVSATDSDLVVYFPSAIPAGSYLLTVRSGDGEGNSDTFSFAVESLTATGPQGPQG